MPQISRKLAKEIRQEMKETKDKKQKWNLLMGILGYNQFIVPNTQKGGEK